MAVFDLFKRLVNANTTGGERRADERVRATLGARVLVVDDSATIRAVLGKMLLQDGYEVLKAADGEAAIELARSQLPDLIFLDIVLPGMSGFAVLRALRRDSGTRSTPIVMMSGNQQATEQFYVQRFGADGFVRKPFGRIEVFHAIRSLVQARRMPARVIAPAPTSAIPEGISAEDWAAIPDIAMPDAEHVVPGYVPPASSPPRPEAVRIQPVAAAARSLPGAPAAGVTAVRAPSAPVARAATVITGAATSMAIRATLSSGARLAWSPSVTLPKGRSPGSAAAVTGAPSDASKPRRERKGDD